MIITSMQFIVFCIILTIAYFLIPKSWQWILLLGFSMYFYTRSGYIALIFLLVTVIIIIGVSVVVNQNYLQIY